MKVLKQIVLFVVIATMLASLVACGGAVDKAEESTTDKDEAVEKTDSEKSEPEVSKDPVTLSYFIAQTHNKDFQGDIADKFMEKYPNVTVDRLVIPDDQFETNLKVKFATGEAPDVVCVMYGKNMKNYNYDNFLGMDDTEPWVSRLLDPEATKHDGKVMGFKPAKDSGVGILYNKDIFAKYSLNVPKNYDEFVKTCATLKENGELPVYFCNKDTWTLQIWLAATAPVAVRDQPDFWQNINSNKQKFADSKELEDVLAKQLALLTDGYVNEDHLTATYDMANQAVAEGKAAMYLMGAWAIPEMQKVNKDINMGVFAVPFFDDNPDIINAGALTERDDPQYGAADVYYGISAEAKNINEAKLYLDFLAQAENVAAHCEAWGQLPNFKGIEIEMTDFQKEYVEKYSLTGREIPEMNGRLLVDLGELWNYEQNMLAGGMTPKQVLEAWDKKYSELCKAKEVPGF